MNKIAISLCIIGFVTVNAGVSAGGANVMEGSNAAGVAAEAVPLIAG